MLRATTLLRGPRFTNAAATVAPVSVISATNTAKYFHRGTTCPDSCNSVCALSMATQEVKEGKEKDPDHVDEVPVEPGALDPIVVSGGESPAEHRNDEPG